jgi:ribosomal protein L11 methylase PrmA
MVATQDHRSVGSFRDPGGFVFQRDGVLYRQVNRSSRADYDLMMDSGFYRALVEEGRLIAHEEADVAPQDPEPSYKVLRPEPIPFISYPYEWCFSQLKDAALLTLAIEREALRHGMTLKDASAYNIQFRRGQPVFIDTLSFEAYQEGEPWVAYRQFCQHFLAPLALMSLTDVRLNQLSRTNIDGVPLDLAARLLPWRSRLRPSLAVHVHLHARLTAAYAGGNRKTEAQAPSQARPDRARFSERSLLGLIDHLESAVRKLRWEPGETPWSGYYGDNTYTENALARKEATVARYLDRIQPAMTWDLGANTGRFSRVSARRGTTTIAFDIDPGCVERNYREVIARGETHLLPLLLDVTNPSPASGWQESERTSFLGRGPVDAVLALALVHHLAIANNLPLARIADFFQQIGRWAVIEFVPKGDPQVSRLLASRKDIFPDYHQREFERCFQRFFDIEASEPLPESERVLYLLRRR